MLGVGELTSGAAFFLLGDLSAAALAFAFFDLAAFSFPTLTATALLEGFLAWAFGRGFAATTAVSTVFFSIVCWLWL